MGHMESCLNQEGPPCKAKYSVTEEPLVGSVIEHETVIFQVVGGANRRSRSKTEMTNGMHKT
jgi:hypothetical protein